MTSLSTRFLGHPRLTKPTFCGRCGWPSAGAVELGWIAGSFNAMEATILASGAHMLLPRFARGRVMLKAPRKIAPVDSEISRPCYARPLI